MGDSSEPEPDPELDPLSSSALLRGLTQRRISRRDLLRYSGIGAAALLPRPCLAAEGPPETTSVRLLKQERLCIAPEYVVADLLRAEGFTDIRYVSLPPEAIVRP